MSLTNYRLTTGVMEFIGLDNFKYLFEDPKFMLSLKNTGIYAGLKISLDTTIALAIALALDSHIPFRRWLRSIYFAPVVVPVVASSLIWLWFYDPGVGPFNQVLNYFGFGSLKWLYHESTSMLSILIFSVWKGLGYNVVLILAGLQSISDSYIEAAKVDGAKSWQITRHIKIPLISPILSFVVMIGIINSFKVFTEINVMTPNGGPLNSTMLAVTYIYEQAFTNGRMGRGSAAALVLFLIILVLTLIQKKISSKTVKID
jgi:ABC-type sugar transport system permease subunit